MSSLNNSLDKENLSLLESKRALDLNDTFPLIGRIKEIGLIRCPQTADNILNRFSLGNTI